LVNVSSNELAARHLYFHLVNTSILLDGTVVHETYSVTPTTGDVDLSNNVIVRDDTVKASYDPNAISVSPQGCLQSGEQLRYTIQFENTGHDTAFNIFVLDTLSDDLDPMTLRMVMSSDKMYVTKFKGGGHTILKFDFPGINLPDSSHHGLCDGMLIYDIKAKPDMATGASIANRAGIYFDYNPVVMTNTAGNTKCFPTNVAATEKDPAVRLYPNPAGSEVTISTTGNFYTSLEIANSIGQIMISSAIKSAQTKVDLMTLPAGIYYVTLTGAQGKEVHKLIKW